MWYLVFCQMFLLILFCISTAYVFLFGKHKTHIKFDYFVTVALVMISLLLNKI
jgi:hypothetical protein